jgi:hypothetical protein
MDYFVDDYQFQVSMCQTAAQQTDQQQVVIDVYAIDCRLRLQQFVAILPQGQPDQVKAALTRQFKAWLHARHDHSVVTPQHIMLLIEAHDAQLEELYQAIVVADDPEDRMEWFYRVERTISQHSFELSRLWHLLPSTQQAALLRQVPEHAQLTQLERLQRVYANDRETHLSASAQWLMAGLPPSALGRQ